MQAKEVFILPGKCGKYSFHNIKNRKKAILFL